MPDEPTRLAIVAGRDFRGLKGVVEALLARLHADGALEARPVEIPLFAAGPGRRVAAGDTHLGYLGEIDGANSSISSCGNLARRQSWSSMSY